MNRRRSPQTDEELVRSFLNLFDEVVPDSPEDVDEFLRESGYDPDDIGARIQAVAKKALKDSPLNWRKRAGHELRQVRDRLENFAPGQKEGRTEIITAIQEFVVQHGLATANFRNMEQATEEDLASLLFELEFLIDQQDLRADIKEEE